MQRLTRRESRVRPGRIRQAAVGRWRRRADTERGAVAVTVALFMVALIAFGALAVDVTALWSDRKQLQNGADAAALAIAQACANDLTSADCTSGATALADSLVKSNVFDGTGVGTVTAIVRDWPGQVTVLATAHEASFLAGVMGQNATTVTAKATAAWKGSPTADSTLPLILGNCYLSEATKTDALGNQVVTYKLLSSGNGGNSSNANPCSGNQKNPPGGFGWLVDPSDKNNCLVPTEVGQWADGQTGKPAKCGDVAALLGGQGSKVILPLYDYSSGQGSSGEYLVIGYVALQLQTYCIDQTELFSDGTFGHCGQGQQFIEGTVVPYADTGTPPESSGPPAFGYTFVGLTE